MSTQVAEVADSGATQASIGFFERWLTEWVFLCIGVGIALGAKICFANRVPRRIVKNEC
jgi:ACR3 family arsenite efflux pump ArsB